MKSLRTFHAAAVHAKNDYGVDNQMLANITSASSSRRVKKAHVQALLASGVPKTNTRRLLRPQEMLKDSSCTCSLMLWVMLIVALKVLVY
jgi:hypothetical protein